MRIAAPPVRYPVSGVDSYRWRLIAASVDRRSREFIGADSLGYISIDGLVKSIGLPKFCMAVPGNYPIPYSSKWTNSPQTSRNCRVIQGGITVYFLLHSERVAKEKVLTCHSDRLPAVEFLLNIVIQAE
jgi:hypothetical protein